MASMDGRESTRLTMEFQIAGLTFSRLGLGGSTAEGTEPGASPFLGTVNRASTWLPTTARSASRCTTTNSALPRSWATASTGSGTTCRCSGLPMESRRPRTALTSTSAPPITASFASNAYRRMSQSTNTSDSMHSPSNRERSLWDRWRAKTASPWPIRRSMVCAIERGSPNGSRARTPTGRGPT